MRPGANSSIQNRKTIDFVVFTDFPATKRESSAKIQVKTLLIAFFDNKAISYKEFVLAGQTIISACY